MLEKYYLVERTGKLVKIVAQNNDWAILENDFQMEQMSVLDECTKTVLISQQESKKLIKFIKKYKKDIKVTIIDNHYFNEDQLNIDNILKNDLERREGVKFPNQKKSNKEDKDI